MADSDVDAPLFRRFCAHDVAVLSSATDKVAIEDAVDERLAQLHAMTSMINGEVELFDSMPEEIKSNYLWMIDRTVQEIRALREHQLSIGTGGAL